MLQLQLYTFLAQVDNAMGARVILNGSNGISDKVSESWDYTWEVALTGGLYTALNNVGVFVAMGCLGLWLLQFAKRWMEGEGNPWVFQELLYPVIVIIFLANGGSNLATLSKGMRDTLNHMNRNVVAVVANGVSLDQTLQELGDYAAIEPRIAQVRDQCNTITENEKMAECLKLQNEAIQGILAEYRRKHGATVYFDKLKKQAEYNMKHLGEAATGAVISGVNAAMSAPMAIVVLLMGAVQWCFQMLVECAMLLTALMGPIALGASLLPFGAKPVFAWLTSFWSLALCKLSYNVAAGMTAVAVYKLADSNTLGTAIFFGIFSPILAIALSAGGGMAIFNGILAASTAVAGIGVAKLPLGGGGAGTAQAASNAQASK